MKEITQIVIKFCDFMHLFVSYNVKVLMHHCTADHIVKVTFSV